jgi:hypothetical protein
MIADEYLDHKIHHTGNSLRLKMFSVPNIDNARDCILKGGKYMFCFTH